MRKTQPLSEKPGTGLTRREFTRKLTLAGMGLPLAGSLFPSAALHPHGHRKPGKEPDPWKINLFSKHMQFLGYEEMAAACVEAGVDGVDLTVRPGGHVLPENVERDLPLAVKAVKNAGLELPMMATGITDPDDPLTEKVLKVASDQGIRYYRLGYYRYGQKLGIANSLEGIRDKMERLSRMNEKYGLHGAYQNHAGNYFGAPVWDLWQVIRDLDPRWIGCQYDIRHAHVEGAQSWPMALELLREHIRCLVIKDYEWGEEDDRWRIRNVPVGTGMVDFKRYFGLLKDYGISGPISLHIEYPLYPDENMPVPEKRAAAIQTVQQDVRALKGFLPG